MPGIGVNVLPGRGARLGAASAGEMIVRVPGAIVGGGSVVTRDVPPACIVAGNPARILRRYDAARGEWVREP